VTELFWWAPDIYPGLTETENDAFQQKRRFWVTLWLFHKFKWQPSWMTRK